MFSTNKKFNDKFKKKKLLENNINSLNKFFRFHEQFWITDPLRNYVV